MSKKQNNIMADKKETTSTTETKVKKVSAPRKSAKQLIAESGKRGVIAVMAQVAFSLALKNKFEGTGIENKNEKGELMDATRQHATVYHLTRPEKGIILNLDEKSATFASVLAKAKACKADLENADEPKYSKNVQAFIKELLKLKPASENKLAALKGASLD